MREKINFYQLLEYAVRKLRHEYKLYVAVCINPCSFEEFMKRKILEEFEEKA